MINFDEYSDIGTHWIAFHVNSNNVTYFESFGVEHILKEIKAFIKKTLKQTFLEYKHTIQECGNIFALDLLILCLKENF